MHVAIWIALALCGVALVVLLLTAVSILQRLGPLRRALDRLAQRQARAQDLAERLQQVQRRVAAIQARHTASATGESAPH